MWEERHGFPTPDRLASGHRRYGEDVVQQVQRVQRRREAGVRLDAAVAEVTAEDATPPTSVYAELRAAHPELLPNQLRKSTLLALTKAIEDECCARAQQPWLLGSFQLETYYEGAERRWRDLARTARGTYALAAFHSPQHLPDDGGPLRVEVPVTAAMVREWTLICVARDFPAALAAWELPGQDAVPDDERVFETLWTLDRTAVLGAAHAYAGVLTGLGQDATELVEDLHRTSGETLDIAQAAALFSRVLSYVERLR